VLGITTLPTSGASTSTDVALASRDMNEQSTVDRVPPENIDRYQLKEVLGTGSFATVWRAHDPVVGLDVALKVLADNWARSTEMRERFMAEARIGMSVNSTRMVRVHTVNETADGVPYIVMTFADRGTLADRFDARIREASGPYSLREAISIGERLALGLADLHQAGHVHRDLKPANVLFQNGPAGEELLLGDLGLARAVDNTSITLISGSPGYVAPEQAAGLTQLTNAADLYPLGIILTELLTGEPTVSNTSLTGAAEQGPIDVADHFARRGRSVPTELIELIDELLQVDPLRRPGSAAEVAERLSGIVRESSSQPTEVQGLAPESTTVAATASPQPQWQRLPVIGLALLALVVVGVVTLILLNDSGEGDQTPGDTSSTTTGLPTTSGAAVATVDTAEPTVTNQSVAVDLARDVPLPPGSVLDRANTRPGVQIDADVAMPIDEVLDFYNQLDEWNFSDERREDDGSVSFRIRREADLVEVTAAPTALTSGTLVTNLVVVPASS